KANKKILYILGRSNLRKLQRQFRLLDPMHSSLGLATFTASGGVIDYHGPQKLCSASLSFKASFTSPAFLSP
ncbi:MAG TPA: hypothetical protein VK638_42970, partial [Edaphobacter sp.]|nr:hypothetical protein [Edaphobacter sp.]